MKQHEQLDRLVRDILGESYLTLEIPQYVLEEDVSSRTATIRCKVAEAQTGGFVEITGSGVGLIDAIFQGLKSRFSKAYPSLDHIEFVDFSVSGDFSKTQTGARSDAEGRVSLVVRNSSGERFVFESASSSVTASSVAVVARTVQHFVNAELAVLRVYEWIQDARRRNRADLVERYTHNLADLVKNSSYSETIERRRKQLEI